ncbi:MAG: NAD(P)H-hydrate dehydratase [Nevskiaceae bacterium]|jgi:NAD(P)H-hydrate epimerase|nr:NAD(P)H-hydrate dehydratase [Nevskiaceae bacterium]
MDLPSTLHTAAQVRRIEAAAMEQGVPEVTLMSRAGAAACRLLLQRWPQARRIGVVCGGGNNGGDGFVVAQLLRESRHDVRVITCGDAARTGEGAAAQAWKQMLAAGVEVMAFNDARAIESLRQCDVIVDALLGIGVRAPLKPEAVAVIDAINDCARPVLSLDVPSGLDPDSGAALPAVRATATITFLAVKQGLYLRDGPRCRGELRFDSLGGSPGSDDDFVTSSAQAPALRRLGRADLSAVTAPRSHDAHKSQFGRVLIVGGGPGMPGAVRLAGEAALRVGAGLVTVATLAVHQCVVLGARPELMCLAIDDAASLAARLPAFDVIAIGPGLGTGEWSRLALWTVLSHCRADQGLVVDADALNLLSMLEGLPRNPDWILTPHPGEAARLLDIPIAQVQADRPAALAALVERWGGVVALKGAGTLIGRTGTTPLLCDLGNPGMAVPGMGDVLTGAISGLLAQHRDPLAATAAGVYLHALAGDQCASGGERGILALEVAGQLRTALGQAR